MLGEVPIETLLVIRDRADMSGEVHIETVGYSYFASSAAFLGAWTFSEVEKIWCAHEEWRNLHISEVSYLETLTSATYRLLGHTTHTVTPIDLKFCTDMQASVLYKIAIGTTNLRLEKNSAILNFVKNTFW